MVILRHAPPRNHLDYLLNMYSKNYSHRLDGLSVSYARVYKNNIEHQDPISARSHQEKMLQLTIALKVPWNENMYD